MTESVSSSAIAAVRAASAAPRTVPGDAAAAKAVAQALDKPAPVFNTHSQGLAGMMAAQLRQTREKMADVQAKISELQAELTDLMRVESAIGRASDALVVDQHEEREEQQG